MGSGRCSSDAPSYGLLFWNSSLGVKQGKLAGYGTYKNFKYLALYKSSCLRGQLFMFFLSGQVIINRIHLTPAQFNSKKKKKEKSISQGSMLKGRFWTDRPICYFGVSPKLDFNVSEFRCLLTDIKKNLTKSLKRPGDFISAQVVTKFGQRIHFNIESSL